MKNYIKSMTMGALALAIVMAGIVSNPKVVNAKFRVGADREFNVLMEYLYDDDYYEDTVTADNVEVAFKYGQDWNIDYRPDPEAYYIVVKNAKVIGDNAFNNAYYNEECYPPYDDGYEYPGCNIHVRHMYKLKSIEFEDYYDHDFDNNTDTLSEYAVTIIGYRSFKNCASLETITCPNVKIIGEEAFHGCAALNGITLEKVQSIGNKAFYGCSSLEKVEFKDKDEAYSIADDAFMGVGAEGDVNNPVLKLPADWPSEDLPKSDGSWHGGYFRYITNISFTDNSHTLVEGANIQLSVETTPVVYEKEEVAWESSNTDVATVDQTGKLTAVSEGIAIITATSKLDDTKITTCTITVNQRGDVVDDDLDGFTDEELASEELKLVGIDKEGSIYTGSAITFDIRVYKGNKILKEGVDYTLKYKNNKLACTDLSADNAPRVVLTGKGAYAGTTQVVKFKINPVDISDNENVVVSNASVVAGDKTYKPLPAIILNGKKLKAKTDYSVEYDSTHSDGYKEAGVYEITLKGKGNYTGTVTSVFTVADPKTSKLISKATVSGYAKKLKYDGNVKIQDMSKLVVKLGKGKTAETLKEGEDYTVSYIDNTEIGTAYMIIKATPGNEKYVGEKIVPFKITGGAISKIRISYVKNQLYTGRLIKPEVKVALKDGTQLIEGTDYTVEYRKNVNVGTASIILRGKGAYTGTVKKSFKINPIKLSNNEAIGVVLGTPKKNDKGAYIVDTEVRNNGKLLVKGVDYTIKYKNNKKAGKADDKNAPAVMIKGKGNYSKSIVVKFDITE